MNAGRVRARSSLCLFRTSLLVVLLAAASVAHAQTILCGNISGTWKPSGNPYIVTCDCTVPAGQTLTIQPGVEVWIAENMSLTVNGVIQAVGTPTQRITFQAPIASQYWSKIYCINTAATNRFKYCDFRNADTALWLRIYPERGGSDTMNIEIMNCSFSNCITRSIFGESLGSSRMYGLSVFEADATLNVTVNNCVFTAAVEGCRIAISGEKHPQLYPGYGYAYPRIAGNLFKGLSGSAFLMSVGSYAGGGSPLFVNNTISDCSVGVDSQAPWDARILDNIFVGTTTAVKTVGALSREVNYNCFHANMTNFVGYEPSYGAVIIKNRNGTDCDLHFNIFQDPLFAAAGDLRLASNSPCIDAGTPDAAFADVCFPPSLGTEYPDLGAYGGPTAYGWPLPCTSPSITAQPQRQSGCLGYSASFSVTATGTEPLSYQWLRDDTPLAGQTGATLNLANLQYADAGLYSVIVSDSCGSVTSAPAALAVFDACVDIHMYAGLNITGQAGQTYLIKYTTDPGNPDLNTWTPLATNTLAGTSWFYLDMDSPFSPKRFYGVKLAP